MCLALAVGAEGEVRRCKLDPSLKAPCFQTLIVKKDDGAFSLNPGFLRLRHYSEEGSAGPGAGQPAARDLGRGKARPAGGGGGGGRGFLSLKFDYSFFNLVLMVEQCFVSKLLGGASN